MKLWTIQDISILKTVQETGIHQPDLKFIYHKSFGPAYDWLFKEIKEQYPFWKKERGVWFWDKKPDLRKEKYFLDPEYPLNYKENVLIEIEADPILCVRTDFDLWHYVLNQCPCDISNRISLN